MTGVQTCALPICVGVNATRDEGVLGAEQLHAVATGVAGGEAVVQNCGGLHLLGVSHGTGQSLGVTSRQAVVQVIFDRFFSDRETQGDGFVGVTGGERFLRVVVSDGRAFVLDRCSGKASQLGFFFKATL